MAPNSPADCSDFQSLEGYFVQLTDTVFHNWLVKVGFHSYCRIRRLFTTTSYISFKYQSDAVLLNVGNRRKGEAIERDLVEIMDLDKEIYHRASTSEENGTHL